VAEMEVIMKFACEQKYFNNGTVKAKWYEVPDDTNPQSEEHPNYDYYLDIFDTAEEAHRFCMDSRKA
jgi:hypothetical protein